MDDVIEDIISLESSYNDDILGLMDAGLQVTLPDLTLTCKREQITIPFMYSKLDLRYLVFLQMPVSANLLDMYNNHGIPQPGVALSNACPASLPNVKREFSGKSIPTLNPAVLLSENRLYC